MTDFAFFFTEERVVNFVLLFVRVGGFFVFVPFFSSMTIYPTLKAALAFYITLVFYPILPAVQFEITVSSVMLAIFTELIFGLAVGVVVQLVFASVQLAGEKISYAMSFSMASTMDPQTQTNSNIITQFLFTLAILVFLAFDGHHMMLLFLAKSLSALPLGTFMWGENYLRYVLEAFGWMFAIGISIAFPIIALTILADTVFGMIMKTVPSFNLLVVGIPAKIFVAILVFVATVGGTVYIFKNEFLKAFNMLEVIF